MTNGSEAKALAASGRAAEEGFRADTAGSEAMACKNPAWVEIRLVDGNGQPLAGARCRIHPPSGPPIDKVLDDEGLAYVEGIDPGECRIELPDHPSRKIEPA